MTLKRSVSKLGILGAWISRAGVVASMTLAATLGAAAQQPLGQPPPVGGGRQGGGRGGAQDTSPAAGERTWQGYSVAEWFKQIQFAGLVGAGRAGTNFAGGNLKVVTSNMKPGYLRKNGVPYSENTVLTEYFNRHDEPNGDQWIV